MERLELNKETEELYRQKNSKIRNWFFSFTEKIYKKLINNNDDRIGIIVKEIEKSNAIRILEIGCGIMPIYNFLPKNYQKKCKYYVCDINQNKIEYIKINFKNIKIANASALMLPYPDNFFDFVFSKGLLHHIDEDNEIDRENARISFLKETMRVSKNDAKKLLMDFNYNPKSRKDLFWHYLHKIILSEGEHNFLNGAEAVRLFNKAGFKNIDLFEFDTFKGQYYKLTANK